MPFNTSARRFSVCKSDLESQASIAREKGLLYLEQHFLELSELSPSDKQFLVAIPLLPIKKEIFE